MRGPFINAIIVVLIAIMPAAGQTASQKVPRTAADKLSGIWQAIGTAHWDIEGHSARPGPIVVLGAVGAIPGGLGVVEGGRIPYQPWAEAKRKEHAANWLKSDPEIKCYLPGIPRATYMPFPFQIVAASEHILMTYEFANASRIIHMNKPNFEAPIDSWMGHARGRWEGETLVVDVTSFNDQTWFDRAGNFHSDALHVVERYTPISADVLRYEAAIEDPKVFTRPWKISMPLYRRLDQNMQLLEFKCVEFVEELMYGPFRKKASR